MKEVIVLGAGMAGVGVAIHLQMRGVSVTLVGRREPGRETSFGNAGLIQAEAAEPYALPRSLSKLLRIATGISNDVAYSLGDLPRHAGALFRYWYHSAPARYAPIGKAYAALVAQATAEHAPLIAAAGAEDLVSRRGFRSLHRTLAGLDAEAAEARHFAEAYGVKSRILSSVELMAAEPNLLQAGVGAVHWEDTWAVRDPGALVAAYARHFEALGGRIVTGDAASLRQSGPGWQVSTDEGVLSAEAVVVALGPWSPMLLKRFGYHVAMVEKRGYHRHYATERSLDLPTMDAANGYVLAPMARGLRITTGAELSPVASRAPSQLRRAEIAARQIISLGAPVEDQPWSGIRPCMPDMLPVVGEAPRHRRLWLHFGHGHQGFTLGPATGRLLAELMMGEAPYLDPTPYHPIRLF